MSAQGVCLTIKQQKLAGDGVLNIDPLEVGQVAELADLQAVQVKLGQLLAEFAQVPFDQDGQEDIAELLLVADDLCQCLLERHAFRHRLAFVQLFRQQQARLAEHPARQDEEARRANGERIDAVQGVMEGIGIRQYHHLSP
ncbi:hypothetical protein [Azotobacter armeniacus]